VTRKFFSGLISGILLGALVVLSASLYVGYDGPVKVMDRADITSEEQEIVSDVVAEVAGKEQESAPETADVTVSPIDDVAAESNDTTPNETSNTLSDLSELEDKTENGSEFSVVTDTPVEGQENTTVDPLEPEKDSLEELVTDLTETEAAPTTDPSLKDDEVGEALSPSKGKDHSQNAELSKEDLPVTSVEQTSPLTPPIESPTDADQNDLATTLIEDLAEDLKEQTEDNVQNPAQEEDKELGLAEESAPSLTEDKELGRDEATETGPADEVNEQSQIAPVGPAIDAFAVPPVPTENQPLMAVVLVDNGNMRLDPDILGSLPFTVTIAVPAKNDVHNALMRYYRDEGFEVALLIDLPEGSNATEVTEILDNAISTVSEATTILERTPGTLQNSREISTALVDRLALSGHGLVIYDSGVNPALERAKSVAVPVKTIYRNLDQDNGNERAMRRFLDGAAFRAQQEGSVIIAASPSPSVISALTFWSLQERSSSVIKTSLSQALLASFP
jgi:polysaccharide deacetylase 2 family uncharacterized protein YibQ